MRFRTLALALALSCGATTVVQAASKTPAPLKVKKFKPKKFKPGKFNNHAKASKASKVKPRKAPKH